MPCRCIYIMNGVLPGQLKLLPSIWAFPVSGERYPDGHWAGCFSLQSFCGTTNRFRSNINPDALSINVLSTPYIVRSKQQMSQACDSSSHSHIASIMILQYRRGRVALTFFVNRWLHVIWNLNGADFEEATSKPIYPTYEQQPKQEQTHSSGWYQSKSWMQLT